VAPTERGHAMVTSRGGRLALIPRRAVKGHRPFRAREVDDSTSPASWDRVRIRRVVTGGSMRHAGCGGRESPGLFTDCAQRRLLAVDDAWTYF